MTDDDCPITFPEDRWPDDPHDFDPCAHCGAAWDEPCHDLCEESR